LLRPLESGWGAAGSNLTFSPAVRPPPATRKAAIGAFDLVFDRGFNQPALGRHRPELLTSWRLHDSCLRLRALNPKLASFTLSDSECSVPVIQFLTPLRPADASPSPEHRWFNDHVIMHEPLLRAWLRSRFPRGVEIDDLVQESFARVLRARAAGAAMRSPKAFLFATARNLALDVLRHRHVSGEDT
jgi:Sigma-70 region 2